MAEARRRKTSNVVVWVILGLLVLALAGFGTGGFGGNLTAVATVGDREVTVQDYANALRSEQARLEAQTGERLTLEQMQAFGLDRQLMERLLAGAALEGEAERLGLSVGDARVAERIRATPAFQGIAGTFDRDTYGRALQSVNLDEGSYEARVRDEMARELLQAAVVGGTEVPGTYADALATWLAETRDVTLGPVTVADLPGGVPAPDDAALQAFYDADPTRFQTPERREITYAWITPDMLAPELQGDDAALRALYDARADAYRQPPRVLAERLAFADAAAARDARARIESGALTFDALVEARGLTLEDVDEGEIARDDVDGPVADALFALTEPGIAGPVETALGPALYRVNAILDATETPFEDVRDDLAAEYGMDAARRAIDAARDDLDDRLAEGATLEDLAAETDMVLGAISWDPTVTDGIAAYDGFRTAAAAVAEGDFPQVEPLADGGLFALRLDAVVPPAVPPLADVRGAVAGAWTEAETARLLAERAEALAVNPVQDIAGAPEILAGVVRDATLDGVPAAVVDRIFEAAPGDVFAVPGDAERAWVVRLDAVNPADLAQGAGADLRRAIVAQAQAEIAGDLFEGYGQAVQDAAGFTVDDRAVAAVQAEVAGGR